MRSFALMAVLAVYTSALELTSGVAEDDSLASTEDTEVASDEIAVDVSEEAAAEEDAEEDAEEQNEAEEEEKQKNLAIAASIDAAFDKVEELSAPDAPNVGSAPEEQEEIEEQEDYVEPDNTRPPPK